MFKLPENYDCDGYDNSSFKEFQEIMYSLRNKRIIKIYNIVGYVYPLNYYRVDIEYEYEKITILQNCGSRLMAFAIPQEDNCIGDNYTFIDNIKLEKIIHCHYPTIKFVSKEILNTNMSKEHRFLNNDDKDYLSLWLPCSVGEVLFSWFFD